VSIRLIARRCASKAAGAAYYWLPKPHEVPTMEVTHGAWSGVFSCFDVSGRQLGESNVTPFYLRCPVDTEWRPWGGSGSRSGGVYNISALEQIAGLWPAILQRVKLVAAKFRSKYALDESELSYSDLMILAHVLTSTPAFYMRRVTLDLARQRRVTNLHAATYKVTAGVHMALNLMIHQPDQRFHFDRVASAAEFLEFVEDSGVLLASGNRVCSGPQRLILQLLQSMIECPPAEVDFWDSEFEYGLLCARIELDTLYHCAAVAASLAEDLAERKRLFGRMELLDGILVKYWGEPDESCLANAANHSFQRVEQLALEVFQKRHWEISQLLGWETDSRTRVRPKDILHRSVIGHHRALAAKRSTLSKSIFFFRSLLRTLVLGKQ
jgi:hypothetical protein